MTLSLEIASRVVAILLNTVLYCCLTSLVTFKDNDLAALAIVSLTSKSASNFPFLFLFFCLPLPFPHESTCPKNHCHVIIWWILQPGGDCAHQLAQEKHGVVASLNIAILKVVFGEMPQNQRFPQIFYRKINPPYSICNTKDSSVHVTWIGNTALT